MALSFEGEKIMNKTIVSFIIILFLMVSQDVLGFSFRGIEIGKPITQFPECSIDGYLNVAGGKVPNYIITKSQKPCWCKDQDDESAFLIAGLSDIGISGTTDTVLVNTIQSNIEKISMSFDFDDSNDFLTMLIVKYGKPVIKTKTIENLMGATFKAIEATWTIEGNIILFSDRFDKIDEGFLTISSSLYKNTQTKYQNEKIKKGLNGL
jgi:hypothetical protein